MDKMYTFPNCYYKRVQIQSNSGQPMAKIERTRTIGSCEKSSFCFSLQVSTAYTLPRSIFFGPTHPTQGPHVLLKLLLFVYIYLVRGTASVHEGVSSHPPAPTRMCVSSRRPTQDSQEGEGEEYETFPNCYKEKDL